MLILLTEGVKYPIRASKVDGFCTKSYCVQDWLAGGEGWSVVGWYAALSGVKGQLEQWVGFRGGLFAYEVTVIVEGLDK